MDDRHDSPTSDPISSTAHAIARPFGRRNFLGKISRLALLGTVAVAGALPTFALQSTVAEACMYCYTCNTTDCETTTSCCDYLYIYPYPGGTVQQYRCCRACFQTDCPSLCAASVPEGFYLQCPCDYVCCV